MQLREFLKCLDGNNIDALSIDENLFNDDFLGENLYCLKIIYRGVFDKENVLIPAFCWCEKFDKKTQHVYFQLFRIMKYNEEDYFYLDLGKCNTIKDILIVIFSNLNHKLSNMVGLKIEHPIVLGKRVNNGSC